MPRITLEPSGLHFDCAPGQTLFEAARAAGVSVPTACAGKATCGLCRVKVVAGEESLPPPNAAEVRHLGNTYFLTKLRLSCQLRPTAELSVQLPDAPRRKGKK